MPMTLFRRRMTTTPDYTARGKSLYCFRVRLLFTVTESFTIPGRGIVLLPELRPVGEEKFNVGDRLKLRLPNGEEELVHIGGLELLKPTNGPCQLAVILLGKSKEEVPPRTEVWSVQVNLENPDGSSWE